VANLAHHPEHVESVGVSFAATFGAARAVAHLIRSRGGPFRNLVMGSATSIASSPASSSRSPPAASAIGVRREGLDKWLATPFGAGVALVFDEAALLLALEDVYWSPEGI
jgi:hypothetical protein